MLPSLSGGEDAVDLCLARGSGRGVRRRNRSSIGSGSGSDNGRSAAAPVSLDRGGCWNRRLDRCCCCCCCFCCCGGSGSGSGIGLIRSGDSSSGLDSSGSLICGSSLSGSSSLSSSSLGSLSSLLPRDGPRRHARDQPPRHPRWIQAQPQPVPCLYSLRQSKVLPPLESELELALVAAREDAAVPGGRRSCFSFARRRPSCFRPFPSSVDELEVGPDEVGEVRRDEFRGQRELERGGDGGLGHFLEEE